MTTIRGSRQQSELVPFVVESGTVFDAPPPMPVAPVLPLAAVLPALLPPFTQLVAGPDMPLPPD